jgi:hypothetical protein
MPLDRNHRHNSASHGTGERPSLKGRIPTRKSQIQLEIKALPARIAKKFS